MPSFLDAFTGTNSRVPVWLMRQAGRYMPEYRQLRQKYSLLELFRTPETAAAITCLPVEKLGVDAAIVFADILTLPMLLGFDVDFVDGKGPVIRNPLRAKRDFERLQTALENPAALSQTIRLTNERLPKEIPLIGFAGGPFTVLNYLLEGEGHLTFRRALVLMQENPELFQSAM